MIEVGLFELAVLVLAGGVLLVVSAGPATRAVVFSVLGSLGLSAVIGLGIAGVVFFIRWKGIQVLPSPQPAVNVVELETKKIQPPKGKPAEKVKTDDATPRPAWVDAPPARNGNVYQRVVTAGPYASRAECEEALDQQIESALADYADSYLGTGASRHVELPPGERRALLVREEWEEHLNSSVGKMVQLHARLEFSDPARQAIGRQWHAAQVHARLEYTAAAGGGVLLLLSGVFGYLKLTGPRSGVHSPYSHQ
jgi:hypothetical protein